MLEVRKISADDFNEHDISSVHRANSLFRDTYVIYDKHYFEIKMSKDFYTELDDNFDVRTISYVINKYLPVINICSLINGYVFDCQVDPKDESIMIRFYISMKKYNSVMDSLSMTRHFDHVLKILKTLYNDQPYFSFVLSIDYKSGDINGFSEVYLSTMSDEATRIPAKVRRVSSGRRGNLCY